VSTANLTAMHAAVMGVTLICLTVLGVVGALSEGTLSALLSVVVGAVFGAAISQQAANGSARAVADAAIASGLASDRAALATARDQEGR
jgi:hypothetical protein